MGQETLTPAAAGRALEAAQKRLEKIKRRAAQAEAALTAATAAAAEAERRRDISTKIILGALLLSRAKEQPDFARYCYEALLVEPLPPRSVDLIKPTLKLLEHLSQQMPAPFEGAGTQ